jgi:3-deoxy-D-manno-octulosonate 8-phosphate phosphatase (KDO 8-P phosphatase)
MVAWKASCTFTICGARKWCKRVTSLQERAAAIRLILLDVDGVLTDGTVVMHGDGTESKAFHIRDGAAIVWAMQTGIPIGLLSARSSAATVQRATQLGIRIVAQGAISKPVEFERIIAGQGVTESEVAYMGDDLLDIPVLKRVGLAGAPADAAPEVREAVDWVSAHGGGRGAVREFIELVLRAQGQWDAIVKDFSA